MLARQGSVILPQKVSNPSVGMRNSRDARKKTWQGPRGKGMAAEKYQVAIGDLFVKLMFSVDFAYFVRCGGGKFQLSFFGFCLLPVKLMPGEGCFPLLKNPEK